MVVVELVVVYRVYMLYIHNTKYMILGTNLAIRSEL